MKQLQLLRDAGDDFERALFAAVEREPIPLSSKQEVARRLGLAVPELSGFGTVPSPATAEQATHVASAGPAAGAFAASRAERSLWGKLTFLATVGGLGLVWGGSLLGAARTGNGTGAKPSVIVAVPSWSTPASTDWALATKRDAPESFAGETTTHEANKGAAKTIAVEERSTHSSRPRRERRSANASSPQDTASPNRVTPATSTLAAASDTHDGGLLREVRSLDAVRAALRAHDGKDALERLDGYAREFSDGELALESQVLRVAALVQTEQRAAARALALRTLAIPGSTRYRTELEHSLRALERPTAAE